MISLARKMRAPDPSRWFSPTSLGGRLLINQNMGLIRYIVSGIGISLGYTVTVVVLVRYAHIQNAPLANAISLCLWTLISYVVHRDFTFRSTDSSIGSMIKFGFIFLLKLGVSILVVSLFTQTDNRFFLIGVLVNWLVLPLVSYGALKYWAFARGSMDA